MLRDVAVARIQRGLGYRTDQSDNIVLALQEAQRLLERGRTLPYFLLTEGQTAATTVAATNTYTLPTRFLRESGDASMRFVPTSGGIKFLDKVNIKDGLSAYWIEAALETGAPVAYSLRKTDFAVFPTPDAVYTLFWDYYVGAVPLTTNIENAWLDEETGAPEVLIYRAGALIAEDLGNTEAFTKFGRLFQEAWNGMLGDTFQRDEENKPIHMGSRL